MRRGCGAMRNIPFVLPEEQRGFFLRPSNGYPEFTFIGDTKRRSVEIADNPGDLLLGKGPPFNLPDRAWRHPFGEELKCSHAIASHSGEEAVSVSAFRSH